MYKILQVLKWKTLCYQIIHSMPHLHTLWDSELFFFNHLGLNNLSHNPTLSRHFLRSHLGSLLAPSRCFFQLNANLFGSLRVVWSWSTWQVGVCWVYLCFGVMRCSCLPAWLFLFSQLLWKPWPFRRTARGDSRISFMSSNSNSSFRACHSSFTIYVFFSPSMH